MKNRIFSLCLALALFSACDRNSALHNDEQRQTDEKRIAELRDLEQRAAQREADAKAAQTDLERQRLADAQAALDVEKQKLTEERAAVRATAAQQAQWRADEQRLAQRQASLKAEQETAARAQREATTTRARAKEILDRAERTLDSFYSALDPMGDWVQVEPYGYCWQPRVAHEEGWRPYMDGSWAYTNYGWTWKSDEPFGWATYHYGRWARIKHMGWVWVPGSEWAPAWVSWRRSPEYVGWAALPPEAHSGSGFNGGVDSYYDIGPASYNFVASQRFGEPTYRGILAEPERNVTIVNQTVNVTQITYKTIENKTAVFAGGPDPEQINAVSTRQVPRLMVERINEPQAGVANAVVAGGVLQLLAPDIASASRPTNAPAKVRETVKAPEIERGWTGADPGAVQAARAQAKQEAVRAEAHARVTTPDAPPAVPAPVRAIAPVAVPPLAPLTVPPPAPDTRSAEAVHKKISTDAEAAQLTAEKKATAPSEAARLSAEKKPDDDQGALAKPQAPMKAEERARSSALVAPPTLPAPARQTTPAPDTRPAEPPTQKLSAAAEAAGSAAERKAAAEGEAARLSTEKKAAGDRIAAAQLKDQQKAMADREAAAQKLEEAKRALEAQRKAIADKNAAEARAREADLKNAVPPNPVNVPREKPLPAEPQPGTLPAKPLERKLPESKSPVEPPAAPVSEATPLATPKAKLDKKRAAEEASKVPAAPADPPKQ